MTTWIEIAGKRHKVVLAPGRPPEVDGQPIAADIHQLSAGVLSLLLTLPDGTTRSFRCIAEDDAVVLDGRRIPYRVVDSRSLRAVAGAANEIGPRTLKSPMPGRIVRVLVAAGDEVQAGQGCVVIEAMKMQNELKAPKSGKITRLSAAVGDTVAAGATLLVVE
jgi:biotin carboxyl carrier protein